MKRLISNAIRSYYHWRKKVWWDREAKRGVILEAFKKNPHRGAFSDSDSIKRDLINQHAKAKFYRSVYEGLIWQRPYISSRREERKLKAWEDKNLPGLKVIDGGLPEARLLNE